MHVDTLVTADGVGLDGLVMTYDPFGNSLGSLPDNAPVNLDYGWLGQHRRGLEHEAGIATMDVGDFGLAGCGVYPPPRIQPRIVDIRYRFLCTRWTVRPT